MLKLYDYYRSSACFRVRIALNIKNLPYDKHEIHLLKEGGEQFSEHYEQINPLKLVPALQDGDLIVSQSYAIMEYLEDLYPHPSLFPKNEVERAMVRSFALTIVADIHPLINLRVLTFLEKDLKQNEDHRMLWYRNWMNKGLSALEKSISRRAMTAFCFTDDMPTMADICLVPQLFNARRFKLDLEPYPNLVRIDAHCQKLSAFQNAWPKE